MTEIEVDTIRNRGFDFKTSDFRAGIYHNYNFSNDKTFAKCSQSTNYCWDLLNSVAPPISYSKGETTYSYLKGHKGLIEDEIEINGGEEIAANRGNNQIQELKSIVAETRAAIRLVDTRNHAFEYEMHMLSDPVFFRPLRPTPPNRDYILTSRSEKKVEYRGFKKRIPLMEQEEQMSAPIGKKEPVHDSEDRGRARFTQFSKKLAISLLRSDGRIKHFKGQWPKDYYLYKPVGMLYDVDLLHQKNEKFIFNYDTNTSSKFWIGKKSAEEVDKKIGREKDLTLVDLQEQLIKEVEEDIEPQLLPFIKMQHASNEMLMGLSMQGLKALFSPKDVPEAKLNALLHAVYLSQDFGKSLPIIIIDGENIPKTYSQAEMISDLFTCKNRSEYQSLLQCFYSKNDIKLLKPTPDDLYKKCIQLFDISLLPKDPIYLDSSEL